MKRIFLMLYCIAIVFLFLTACGGKDKDGNEKTADAFSGDDPFTDQF